MPGAKWTDAPVIVAKSIAESAAYKLVTQSVSGTIIAAAIGASSNVTSIMTGKVSGGSITQKGVITSGSANRCSLWNSSTLVRIDDGAGQEVYGRLTYAASVWTLTYYHLVAGTETAYTFGVATGIGWAWREVFEFVDSQVIGLDPSLIISDATGVIGDDAIKRNQIELDYTDTGALRAEDIPYDGTTTTKAKIDTKATPGDITSHSNLATGVHNVGASTVASASDVSGAVSGHSNLTTGVHGVAGAVVGTTDNQTLSTKTLTSPTIGDFTNAQHSHAAAGSGGAVVNTHAQGTDQGLDTGGGNAVTAAQAKAGYTHSGVTGNPHSTSAAEVGALGTGHEILTTGIHGVGGSTVASVQNIADHSGLTTGIHGAGTGYIGYVPLTNAGNPNAVVTSRYVGDVCIDTVTKNKYMAEVSASTTSWTLI